MLTPRSARVLCLALVPLAAFVALRAERSRERQSSESQPLAPLAGETGVAELAFEVRARGGGPLPARLSFEPAEGGSTALFTNPAAAPRELAARDNVVYSRTGRARITLPPGRYRVHASHGPEWSLDTEALELAAGQRATLAFELVHELDTPGWAGGDFHLHTLTYSGHGDANLEERVLSFLGEGLDFAVATDHDHLTDYGPTVRALGVEGAVTVITGDEVSTPVGHFNAFPLDPARGPVDSSGSDANALFRSLRAETNPSGLVPLIQVNHPRLGGLDAFGFLGLDPVTGASADPRYARDFDALEILNENLALGYHDPVADGVDTHGHAHSALTDWFHLLNRGERYAAVGNSDSHHVSAILAGYPRNYVRLAVDDPAHIDVAALTAAVRAKQLFTTTGPFVELELAGTPMGGDARAVDGHARLHVRVRAASWVACERALVFVNGERVATLPIAPERTPLRLDAEQVLCFLGRCPDHGRARTLTPGPFDAWVSVVVEGDGSLAPVLRAGARPLALTNPIWVDADGDGRWTSPHERIAAGLRAQAAPALAGAWFAELGPEEQALALELVPRGPFAAVLVEAGFASTRREVLLAAARAAERSVLSGGTPAVQRLWAADRGDPFLDALLLRVITLARREQGPAGLAGYVKRHGQGALRAYASEILPLFPGGTPEGWRVSGPLAGPLGTPPAYAETLAFAAAPAPSASGYLDLRGLGGEDTAHTHVWALTYLQVPAARAVPCFFGSDDGGQLWLNGKLVYENRSAKSANPLEAYLTLELRPGLNHILVGVENGTGGFGFHCRLLDASVTSGRGPDTVPR
jgi:hypothetical protein